ncbi:hypothetical protein NC653_041424 [Populus alba x Populus x berolinensis]|uniref:Uncharacterized protein n=1 Tax=Populus alba x Populus x berolinensis TaxID=444605 RepID=A0AAD6PP61_9ROSI|nr:hypothetical protein NC653_041424 [Populus alba x Populus x berolinensis]
MVCVLMNNLSMRNEGGLFKVLTNFPPTQNIPSPGPSKITFPSIKNKSLHHIQATDSDTQYAKSDHFSGWSCYGIEETVVLSMKTHTHRMLQVASLSESSQLQEAKFPSGMSSCAAHREILRFIAGRTEHARTSPVQRTPWQLYK